MKFSELIKLMTKSSNSTLFGSKMDIIEEKDNRGKIIKMGVPQDVADFLHSVHDKYSLWFADQIKKLPGFQQTNNKLNFVNNLRTQMQGIIDWVSNTPNIILKQYNWTTALEAADQYHKNLTSANIEGIETNTIIKKYNDGFYWVDLESTRCSEEGSAMGHCATTHNAETLYSLRRFDKVTNTTEPFVTLAISPDDGKWVQCKGKNNSKPKKIYYPYIADILISKQCFTFKTEYDARNDFTDVDLENYVEENKDEIPNSDEILEKISADRIRYDDFEKVLKEYKFKYYGINLEDSYDDENRSVYVTYDFYLTLKYSDTGLDKQTIDDNFTLDYRSPARRLLSDNIDGYVTDISIESSYNDEESFNIQASIEADASENSFELSQEGLNSFKLQCDYYHRLDEQFDKEEFINETLPKLLELDGVVTSDLSIFADKVRAKFPNIRVERDAKTLDLSIRFGQISTDLTEEDLSSSSFLRRGNTISLTSQHEDLSKDRYNDINLYIMFWEFINNHLLDNYKTLYAGLTLSNGIDLSAKYYFADEDTEYNFDKEFEHVSQLINEMPSIAKYLTAFEERIVIPFCRSGEPITLKDIVKPEITTSSYSVGISTKDGIYVGTLYLDSREPRTMEYISTLIKDLIDKQKNLYGYRKINSSKIYDFLDELVNRQLTFKDFFEGYVSLNKVI